MQTPFFNSKWMTSTKLANNGTIHPKRWQVSNRPFERHDDVRKEARKIVSCLCLLQYNFLINFGICQQKSRFAQLLAARATESNPQEPARPEQFEEERVKRVYTNQKQGLLAPGLVSIVTWELHSRAPVATEFCFFFFNIYIYVQMSACAATKH